MKLKLETETWNWNLKFNLEIETWNWTWNWTHSPSLWFDLESGLFNLYFCLDFSYIQDELTIQTTLLLLLPHERLRIQERWDQLHSHFEISMFRSFLSDFNPLPPLKIDFCYIIGLKHTPPASKILNIITTIWFLICQYQNCYACFDRCPSEYFPQRA